MNHTCLCLPSRSWYSFTDMPFWYRHIREQYTGAIIASVDFATQWIYCTLIRYRSEIICRWNIEKEHCHIRAVPQWRKTRGQMPLSILLEVLQTRRRRVRRGWSLLWCRFCCVNHCSITHWSTQFNSTQCFAAHLCCCSCWNRSRKASYKDSATCRPLYVCLSVCMSLSVCLCMSEYVINTDHLHQRSLLFAS